MPTNNKIHVPIQAYCKLNMQSVWFSLQISFFSFVLLLCVWFPFVPFVSLFLQVFITNLKFQFSQSNESFKLICPLDLTACKFLAVPLPTFCSVCSFARRGIVNFAALNFATATANLERRKEPEKTVDFFPIVLTFH